MNAVTTETLGHAGETDGGPLWGRFFDSIGQDDTESAISGSRLPPNLSPQLHLQQSPHSEVHPDDSASVVDDEPTSALEDYTRRKGIAASSVTGPPAAAIVDDGTYIFKFRTPSGRTHRFQARHDDYTNLRDIVTGKLAADPFFVDLKISNDADSRPDPSDFHLSYTDADGDTVLITSDHDVADAVKITRAANEDRVVLIVQGGKAWQVPIPVVNEATLVDVSPSPQLEIKVDKTEAADTVGDPPKTPVPPSNLVLGIPKDLLLPASIGALAVVIVGVFIVSRLTSSRY